MEGTRSSIVRACELAREKEREKEARRRKKKAGSSHPLEKIGSYS